VKNQAAYVNGRALVDQELRKKVLKADLVKFMIFYQFFFFGSDYFAS